MSACPKPTRMRCPAYIKWVSALPCCVCKIDDGTIVAHHALSGPMARQAPDDTVIPLCHAHHSDIHRLNGNGYFADIDDLPAWRTNRINDTLATFFSESHICTMCQHAEVMLDQDDVRDAFFDRGDLVCDSCQHDISEAAKEDHGLWLRDTKGATMTDLPDRLDPFTLRWVAEGLREAATKIEVNALGETDHCVCGKSIGDHIDVKRWCPVGDGFRFQRKAVKSPCDNSPQCTRREIKRGDCCDNCEGNNA